MHFNKLVIAVTEKTDILLSQSSVGVSVLIEHLSYRAIPSNALLAIQKKKKKSRWQQLLLFNTVGPANTNRDPPAVFTTCGACGDGLVAALQYTALDIYCI